MDTEKIKELATKGFTIKEMREYLNVLFPDSFGFKLHALKEGSRQFDLRADNEKNYSTGLADSDIKAKLYFPQVKRDHSEAFKIAQGGENTYFDFALEDEKGEEYIGSFGFKDRGDVPHEYITKFIVFLQAAFGQPFTVEQGVMAVGGALSAAGYTLKGRKGKYWIEDVEKRLPYQDYQTIEEVTAAFWSAVERKKARSKQAAASHHPVTQENLIESDRFYENGGSANAPAWIVSNENQTEFLSLKSDGKTLFWTPNKEIAYPSSTIKLALEFEEKAEPFIGDVRSHVVDFYTLQKAYAKGGAVPFTTILTVTAPLEEAISLLKECEKFMNGVPNHKYGNNYEILSRIGHFLKGKLAKGGSADDDDDYDDDRAFMALPYDGRDIVHMITNPANGVEDASVKAQRFISECGYTWRGDLDDMKATLIEYAGSDLQKQAKGGPGVGDVADRPGYEWQEAVVKRFDTKAAAENWVTKVKSEGHTNSYRIEEVPFKGSFNYHVIERWQGRKLDPRSYEELAALAIKKGDTVIVNAGRFKDAEAKVIQLGAVGNDYKVEFPDGVHAIVFPGDVKKKELATGGHAKEEVQLSNGVLNQYVVDVLYRDGANYKKFVENILVPEEYIAEYGVPKTSAEAHDGDEELVDMEALCFTPNEFYELADVTYDEDFDHNKLEILEVKKLSDLPAGVVPIKGTSKYKDYSAGDFYATGGPTKTTITYEELVSFDKIKDVEYFIKKYSDGKAVSSWLAPLQNYYNKIVMILDAEVAKNPSQKVRDEKKVAFLSDQKQELEAFNDEAHKKYVKEGYANGGQTNGIQADDYVSVGDGEKGMVISVEGNEAKVELLEVNAGKQRGAIKPYKISELTKIADIFSYVKGKSYKLSVPVDYDKNVKERKEIICIAGEREGDQVWVKSGNATYLFYPEELIGNEVKENAGPNIDFVEFKGHNYPIRIIVIKGHGLTTPTEVVIGTLELEAALSKSKYHGKAGAIDGNIFCYVSEDLLISDAKNLAENLDEKYSIAEPAEYAEGGPVKGKRKHQTKKAVKNSVKHFSEPTNFDIRISKALAEKTLKIEPKCALLKDITVMCKEKGAGNNWVEVQKTDLVSGKFPSIYKTFEVWIVGDLSKEDCKTELKNLI